ncbi:uncharacterized protein MONBRDRAFT_32490 [Monosiga brevicollis MX1]|uniref:Uncharacterized protein n=1 Tax=Monosiga brevicollis TaxID=81824 RepID=A9UZU5_MONBE|nr:uncharacterized protein MONBRDRAFT_32490 [Monosiga brevicollis MX1]EDQ89425.1 predicted protein [Monosiga brevicollis MX1]|eukprot:XP_001746001.1 hypothetical protein [Monosiga brevicollis MX1]
MATFKISDRLQELSAKGEKFVSFEFFPPRTDDGVTSLMSRIQRYNDQQPLFMDMTWGAGGSTSDLTLDLCTRMVKECGANANMHLTCTNMPSEKIDIALKGARDAGIRNIVALRGDPPAGEEAWEAVEGGYSCALDLVKHIRKEHGDFFSIAVSGYPEGHPNAITKVQDEAELTESERERVIEMEDGLYVCRDGDFQKEMEYLKAKVDAGADLIITQMVFDAPVYGAFLKACKAYGINIPVVPGIMCIQNAGGFKRMTAFCKSRTPAALRAAVEAAGDDKEAIRKVAVEHGAQLCRDLQAAGAPGLHFYTLNLEKVTLAILDALNLNKVPVE